MSNQLSLSIRTSGANGSERIEGNFTVVDPDFLDNAFNRLILAVCNVVRAIFSCFGVSQVEVRLARVGDEALDSNGLERSVLVFSNELRAARERVVAVTSPRLFLPLLKPADDLTPVFERAEFPPIPPVGIPAPRLLEALPEPVESPESREAPLPNNVARQTALGVDPRLLKAMAKLTMSQMNPFSDFEGGIEGFNQFCREILQDPTFDLTEKTRDQIEAIIKTNKITDPNASRIAFVIGLINKS